MGEPDWLVQIYEMTDRDSHELIVELLTGVDQLNVSAGPAGPDYFVTVVLHDASRARSVYQLVTSVDPNALLIHSGTERVTRLRRGDSMGAPPAPKAFLTPRAHVADSGGRVPLDGAPPA
jgi:hypothetical protein